MRAAIARPPRFIVDTSSAWLVLVLVLVVWSVQGHAIITAVFRALMAFYDVKIPREILPSLILSVEPEDTRWSEELRKVVIVIIPRQMALRG